MRTEKKLHQKHPSCGTSPKGKYYATRVRDLKFVDGYASNLTRCVDMQSLKLHSVKNLDSHVFMERLLLIALKEFCPVHL